MSVRSAPDNYFVRLDVDSAPSPTSSRGRVRNDRHAYDTGSTHRKTRRRKRVGGGRIMMVLLAIGLAAWVAWAAQQPGGVSGTVSGFIAHVRGDVQDVSGGASLKHASGYFNNAYAQNGVYPRPTEEQLGAADIGVDVDVVDCGGQGVVLRTLTVSRLLVAGKDLGEVSGSQACPADLNDPSPWKPAK